MWRIVLTVVLWNTISSQPVTDDLQSRQSRQVDFVECCPCPGSSRADLQDLGAKSGPDDFSSPAAVDDCPCRLRDPDSQGSTSVFLPRAVRPVRPFMTAETPKEEVKPLLKPEVGLASSMLETLKEVTDEEYKEALARDAARNEARVAELGDTQPDTAKSVVTIIVNPREDASDALPEASQPIESRCVQPLGQVREAERSPIFKLQPNHLGRSLLDMDSGASEVQKSVVTLNKGLEGLKLKTTSSLLKLFPPRKADGGNIQSLLNIKKNNLPKNTEGIPKKLDGSFKLKLPVLKLPSLFRKNEDSNSIKPLSLGSKLNVSKIRTSLARKPKGHQSGNDDSNPLPSIIQEQIVEPTTNRNTLFRGLPNLTKTPFTLENLLNLKDVELIPPKSSILKFPDLKLLPPLRINKPGTKFVKQSKSERLSKNCNTEVRENGEDLNVRRDERIHTEIIDAIPHASENNPVTVVNRFDATNTKTDGTNEVLNNGNVKTEILDALPSASEINEFANLNNIETSTPRLEEETTNSDGDLVQHIEETKNKQLKDNVEKLDSNIDTMDSNIESVNSNDNSVEFVLENNGNSKFEEFDLALENDQQPMHETDISDTLDEGVQSLDVQIDENDAFVPPSFTFSADDGETVSIEELSQDVNEFESEPIQEPSDLEFNPVPEVNGFQPESTQDDFELEFNPVEPDVQEIEFEPEQETVINDDTASENQFFRQDSTDQDAIGETSNQNIQIASREVSGYSESVSPMTTSKSTEFLQTQEEELKPTSDLLSSIKERISLKLKSLKNPDRNIITISRLSEPETTNNNDKYIPKSSLNSDEAIEVDPLTENTEKNIVDEKSAEMASESSSDNTNQVNMEDLQQMSDSLLRKSEKEVCNCNLQMKENNNEKSDTDMDSSATSLKETFGNNNDSDKEFGEDARNEENDESVMELMNTGTISDDRTSSIEDKTVNTCPSNLQVQTKSVSDEQKEKSVSNIADMDGSEMASGASETVFETVPPLKSSVRNPSSPLLQQSIVVQPASLFPPIPSLDLSNVNLPSLDELRQGISNIFNARAADDEETSSTNLGSINDCPDSNPLMSFEASTSNSKSVLSPLRPLEDINLDIFQINPLSQSNSLLSKMPTLNLNSFRTKLALPKSLDLRPMKLQSALGGRNGGLLGATLTFGPDKSSTRKAKPITKLGSILNGQGSDILGNALSNMQNLEDLRSTMRANAASLLKSPLASPLDDTLRTTQAFGDSLRSHAENTMRNLQQSLSSTLNEARVNSAGEKFAKPQDLLEMVSSAHEDVKDKLYGIHVDLQDRLTSLHDNILDRSKLQIPMLQTPLLSGLGLERQQNIPSGSSRSRSDSKKPSPKLIVKKRKPTERVNKPKPKPKELNKVKPFKISKAASSLTPKAVEVPKLTVTSSKPPFLRPLQRDQRVELKETMPMFGNNDRQLLARKKFRPFGSETKVTIGTTPRPASFRTRPTIRPQLRTKPVSSNNEQPTRIGNQRVRQFKSFVDASGFASESQPKMVPPPVKPASAVRFATLNSEDNHEVLRASPLYTSSSTLPDFSLGNPMFPTSKLSASSPKLGSPTLGSLTLPKPTESPIVSKMRESIRIRLSRPVHQTVNLRKVKPEAKQDMSSSASERKAIAVREQPMKENVSYKCKMVCVREKK